MLKLKLNLDYTNCPRLHSLQVEIQKSKVLCLSTFSDMINQDRILKSRDITLPTKVYMVKAMVFPVVMWRWELDHKEGWALKNWCFQRLEKTLEGPLDSKIKPVHPKGNQLWIFTGRTDAEVEGAILGSPDAKNWLIGKDPEAGKDWRWEEKGTTEDEMVRWHHRLNGHWAWASSRRWWRTGKPSMLQFMGSQRLWHD